MNKEDIIVIADTQVKPDSDLSHLEALSRYIWKHKPKYIVHIGDAFDFPSLSSYRTPAERQDKARLSDDLHSGVQSLDVITEFYQERVLRSKGKVQYNPTLIFCAGNHENRLSRYVEDNPELIGMVDLKSIIESRGWMYYDFLEPVEINDIIFRHYMVNPMSGRAIGGSIENKLNKHLHSFVHGHQQQFQYGRRQNVLGKPHFGVCAGSFYLEDESYRMYENTEIRGFVHMRSFTNRYDYIDYDCEFVSMERLLEDY